VLKPDAIARDERARLRVGWQLNVAVTDAHRSALGGAKVQGVDAHHHLMVDAVTAPDGHIPMQEVMPYRPRRSARTAPTPHTLQATANGITARQLAILPPSGGLAR
jgi:hypothetical protein